MGQHLPKKWLLKDLADQFSSASLVVMQSWLFKNKNCEKPFNIWGQDNRIKLLPQPQNRGSINVKNQISIYLFQLKRHYVMLNS